jgi:hypothetical protein
MEALAPPFDQVYVEPPTAVKVVLDPEQIVGELTVMLGTAFTVTVATAEPVQLAVLPITV